MHFTYNGLKNDELAIYVITEASFRHVVKQAKQFSVDLIQFKLVNLRDLIVGKVKPEDAKQRSITYLFMLEKCL